MVTLTRLDNTQFTLNADEIETVEAQHDCVVTLRSGKRLIVQETPEQITQLVVEYRRKCFLERYSTHS